MEILLQVGSQEDIPPMPENFPKCGQFLPKIGYNTYTLFGTDIQTKYNIH
jgi:hypothetical protein